MYIYQFNQRFDFQEILQYCTAEEAEGRPDGDQEENGVIQERASKSPSPEKFKSKVSFSDSEDEISDTEIKVEISENEQKREGGGV